MGSSGGGDNDNDTLAKLFEMRCQVLLEIGGREWAAVQAADRATRLAPEWHVAWTSLARAQRELGEPSLAAASFAASLRLGAGGDVAAELAEVEGIASTAAARSGSGLVREGMYLPSDVLENLREVEEADGASNSVEEADGASNSTLSTAGGEDGDHKSS